MFSVTVATVKCQNNNCGNSYNCLTFNRQISLYTITQHTKTEEMFLSVLEKYSLESFPLVLPFFLPSRQDIASLPYLDGFCQVQVVWLHKTRQDGLSGPSLCCKDMFSVRILSGKHHCSQKAFDAARFHILPVLSKENNVR